MNCGDNCAIIDNDKKCLNENNNIILKGDGDLLSNGETNSLSAETISYSLSNKNEISETPKVRPSVPTTTIINIPPMCCGNNSKDKVPPSILKHSINYKNQHTLLPPQSDLNEITCVEDNQERTFQKTNDQPDAQSHLNVPYSNTIPRSLSVSDLNDPILNDRLKKRRVSFPVECLDTSINKGYSDSEGVYLGDLPRGTINVEKCETATCISKERNNDAIGCLKSTLRNYWLTKIICSLPLAFGLSALVVGVEENLVIYFCSSIAFAVLIFYPILSVIGALYDFFSPIYFQSKYSPHKEKVIDEEKQEKETDKLDNDNPDYIEEIKPNFMDEINPNILVSSERRPSCISNINFLPCITEETAEPAEEAAESEEEEDEKSECKVEIEKRKENEKSECKVEIERTEENEKL